MNDVEDFRTGMLARQRAAEEAIVRGDPEPRMRLWSRQDPVSLFGAWGPCRTGWDELSRIFRWVPTRFSQASGFSFEVVAADVSGDMAYSVGYERFTASVDGGPVGSYTIRVTHVYRREDGEWKIVHRHGDFLPPDESPPAGRDA